MATDNTIWAIYKIYYTSYVFMTKQAMKITAHCEWNEMNDDFLCNNAYCNIYGLLSGSMNFLLIDLLDF